MLRALFSFIALITVAAHLPHPLTVIKLRTERTSYSVCNYNSYIDTLDVVIFTEMGNACGSFIHVTHFNWPPIICQGLMIFYAELGEHGL